MQAQEKIEYTSERRKLKDFIPLILSFFGGLTGLSVYQHFHLYINGVLDSFINKSLVLLLLHHTGFTAICAIFLAFIFNFLEGRRANLGYKCVKIVLFMLLFIEGLLIAYYVRHYDILGFDISTLNFSNADMSFVFLNGLLVFVFSGVLFHVLTGKTRATYRYIGSMYPFTIVLLGLFLATLFTGQEPINENKTQHLLVSVARELFESKAYDGVAEYPLVQTYNAQDNLGDYFNLTPQKPNIVLIIIDGLGSDFVGDNAIYKGFTPFLESLRSNSLYWEHFLSTTGESHAAVPSLLGSLPFGNNGFTNIERNTNRNTLYGILKSNGYTTSFYYGGNSTLHHLDKFLDEERVDFIMDRKGFGSNFELQGQDAAGITLGYPDAEVYKNYNSSALQHKNPKFDVILTLSTKEPFAAPNTVENLEKVARIAQAQSAPRISKVIKKNKEVFSSIIYADLALSQFFKAYKKRPEFKNTIFIVTGSHNLTHLPARDEASRYRVPFMMYSALLKSPTTIKTLASHADLAPSMVALLHKKYDMKVPQQVAWMGQELVTNTTFDKHKKIPLLRSKNNIQDYVSGKYFFSSGRIYTFGKHLELTLTKDAPTQHIKESFRQFKSINTYATKNNKVLPASLALFDVLENEFTKQEMVWISSVFNGKDFDNAYEIARDLAFGKEQSRALLLCRYILTRIPGHADTEILMGRIYAWQGNFQKAVPILEGAIRKYPVYTDGYAALLDTYFWADMNDKAILLLSRLERNQIKSAEIAKKMKRAQAQLDQSAFANDGDSDRSTIEASITSLYP